MKGYTKEMLHKSGWFTFADGYTCWCHGYNAQEMKLEVFKHGAVVRFERT